MPTLNEIATNIIKLGIGGGMRSDDKLLRVDQVAFWVSYYRSRLIKEYYQKYKNLDPQYIQDLGCIELVCVDKADCCNAGIDETYKKLAVELPPIIDLAEGGSHIVVSLIDKIQPIPMLDPISTFYKKFRKFGTQDVTGFRIGRQIYLDLPKFSRIKFINVRAILEDPLDANRFNTCNGDVCFDEFESEYPIPSYMVQILTEMIIQKELSVAIKTTNLDDKRNDRLEIQESNTQER